MNSTKSAGNHARIKNPEWHEGDGHDSVTVFYSNVMQAGKSIDVTSFANGDLYIGGWGAIPEQVPELASDVQAQPSEIKDMLEQIKRFVNIDTSQGLDHYDAGRCYRPTAIPGRPIITKVDWRLLGHHESHSRKVSAMSGINDHLTVGGLVINTAHGRDGITLGLGSGRLASELVLGQKLSVDISNLGIPDGTHA